MAGARVLLIRRYRASDAEAVRNLHEHALRRVGAFVEAGEDQQWDADLEDIEATYLTSGGEFLVGVINGEIVAMGALRVLDEARGQIKRMRVSPAWQRRGFGRALLGRLEERARELGLRSLILDTSTVQLAARGFYQSAGYAEVARAERHGFELIFMEKTLIA